MVPCVPPWFVSKLLETDYVNLQWFADKPKLWAMPKGVDMLYHANCQAVDAREFGWPLKCIQLHSDGVIQYRCLACNELFTFHISSDLPKDIEVSGYTETEE